MLRGFEQYNMLFDAACVKKMSACGSICAGKNLFFYLPKQLWLHMFIEAHLSKYELNVTLVYKYDYLHEIVPCCTDSAKQITCDYETWSVKKSLEKYCDTSVPSLTNCYRCSERDNLTACINSSTPECPSYLAHDWSGQLTKMTASCGMLRKLQTFSFTTVM